MKKNILVTGSHRSGSTWVGDIVSRAKGVRNVFEPFNLNIKRKDLPFTHWFEHISSRSPQKVQKEAKDYLDSFYQPFHPGSIKRLLRSRRLREPYHWVKDFSTRFGTRTLLKDPIAFMSAAWIYDTYGWDMVILIRHPAAFIASIKVQDWRFPFEDFLNQPILMEDYLQKYIPAITQYAQQQPDIIKQGVLLWNVIHDTVIRYKKQYSDKWYFVRHEDLSLNPVGEFENMFSYLHLSFDDNVRNYLVDSTTSKDDSKLKRNAADNIKSWKKRLAQEEIDEIKEGTREVWQQFYTENDW